MNGSEALKIVSQYYPCSHFSLDTSLGNGKIWAKCEDCEEILHQEFIPRHRKSALEFEMAIETLDKMVNPLIEVNV